MAKIGPEVIVGNVEKLFVDCLENSLKSGGSLKTMCLKG